MINLTYEQIKDMYEKSLKQSLSYKFDSMVYGEHLKKYTNVKREKPRQFVYIKEGI